MRGCVFNRRELAVGVLIERVERLLMRRTLASSREMKLSLFLSRSLNIASAALLLALAPALAVPPAAAGELPLDALSAGALSACVWAANGSANAAATAAAIRVLSFIIISWSQ